MDLEEGIVEKVVAVRRFFLPIIAPWLRGVSEYQQPSTTATVKQPSPGIDPYPRMLI